jgi:hypothetical protein
MGGIVLQYLQTGITGWDESLFRGICTGETHIYESVSVWKSPGRVPSSGISIWYFLLTGLGSKKEQAKAIKMLDEFC